MPSYTAPTRDFRFIINEMLDLESYGNLPGFENATTDMVTSIIDEAGKFTAEATFPEDDHRNFNRDGASFNVGETFAGLPLAKGVELVEGVAVAGFVVAQGAHHAQAFGAGPVVEIRRQHRVAVVGEALRDARLVVAEAEDVVDDDHGRVQAVGLLGQEPAGTHAVAVGYGDVGILGAHGHSLA